MERKRLNGTRLKFGSYDEAARHLEIEFADGSRRLYKGVPAEVFRRLVAAPNAASYFEDRIADEYPNQPASGASDASARKRLDDLFGG